MDLDDRLCLLQALLQPLVLALQSGHLPGYGRICRQLRAPFLRIQRRQLALAPGTAPPAANDRLLLVTESNVTRGQQPINRLVDPLLLGVIIAGAVAIPIAVRNSNNDRPSGS